MDMKKIESSNVAKVLPFHISETKQYHPMFINHSGDKNLIDDHKHENIGPRRREKEPTPNKPNPYASKTYD
jgi:hypothetical protein